ncbi:MAG TPA: peptidylprolyl isomerase [Synergistaceae bacterium]|nr:peptidylprolyl isomerase [Synergistaceae bacterium]
MIAKKGSKVKVHYTGTLKNGDVFDSSEGRSPLEFTVGAGQMIPGFDKGVEGMTAGEKKTITLPPKEAYGEKRDDMLFRVSRDVLPEGYTPSIGDPLRVATDDGGVLNVFIAEMDEDGITLDGNHRLAGEELTFEVTMVEIA